MGGCISSNLVLFISTRVVSELQIIIARGSIVPNYPTERLGIATHFLSLVAVDQAAVDQAAVYQATKGLATVSLMDLAAVV